MFIFIRLSFFIAQFLTSSPFSVLCLNTGVVHKITIFKTGTRFVRSCSRETRVVEKNGKSSVACMASTISIAHRSQHFKPVADGVENSLRRRSEWKVNKELFYLQCTINITLLETLGGIPFCGSGKH